MYILKNMYMYSPKWKMYLWAHIVPPDERID